MKQTNLHRLTLLTALVAVLAGCGQAASPLGASQRAGAMGARQATTLDLLSYNTWGKPGLLGTDKRPRFELIGPAIKSYQVVALQETFTNYTGLVLQHADFPHVKRMENGSLFKLNAGLTTLSRFKMVKTDFAPFEKAGHFDRFARKGVLFTRLDVPGIGEVDLYNTHYQAQDGYEAIRIHDNEVMAAFVKRNEKGNPTFLLGDFNFAPGSVEYKDLQTRLKVRDVYAEANPALPGFTVDPANTNLGAETVRQRIDFIFALPHDRIDIRIDEAAVAMNQPILGRFLSDHFGVAAKVTLVPTQP